MLMRWILATIHLLGFGLALGSIWARARSLARVRREPAALERAFTADNWWGISALVLLSTGLARLFLGSEKAPAYYFASRVFWAKMVVVLLVFALEVRPMVRLLGWRLAERRGQPVTPTGTDGLARISYVQTALVLLLLALATGMARGFGS
jgi:putative membrane protein